MVLDRQRFTGPNTSMVHSLIRQLLAVLVFGSDHIK